MKYNELPPAQLPDATEITNSRDLPFKREQIFKAFENPERLARWWGPNGFYSTFEQFEFRPGGSWRHVMHGPDGKNYANVSVFASIVAPEQVVVDHISSPKFCLTVTLQELPKEKTRLVWRQRFETVEMRNEIAKFAVDCNEQNLDRLAAEVRSFV